LCTTAKLGYFKITALLALPISNAFLSSWCRKWQLGKCGAEKSWMQSMVLE